MEYVYLKVKLIIMNKFFKNFFPQFGWWVFTTFVVEILILTFLPNFVENLFTFVKESAFLRSFIVLIISYILYHIMVTIYAMRKFYHQEGNIKKLDESLYDCYLKFVNEDSNIILERLNKMKTEGADLAWEPETLGVKGCIRSTCSHWQQQDDQLTQRLSAKRRKRMIDISTSLLNGCIRSCLAVECHLYKVITNSNQYKYDEKYRNSQMNKIKKSLLPLKVDRRRIIVISTKEWHELTENEKNKKRLIKYLNWHVSNKWLAKIYILENVGNTSYKMTDLFNMEEFIDSDYNRLTDFVVIRKAFKSKILVFAQNDEENAKLIMDNEATAKLYLQWFDSVWIRQLTNSEPYKAYDVDENLIKNIDNY